MQPQVYLYFTSPLINNSTKKGLTNMKNKSFSIIGLLVLGIAFFMIGMLTILRENILYSDLAQVFQNGIATEIFGVAAVLAGQGLVVFGLMKAQSNKILSSVAAERQATVASFNFAIQQLQTNFQAETQTLKDGYTQTNQKLDTLIKNQTINTAPTSKPVQPTQCKFCGSKIEDGYFCPSCGKAN
jgi:hypothetical protein